MLSTEAQVAMLMLRLLIDRPKELQKVLDYIQREVVLKKAILEVGNRKVATRDEIMVEFEERFGLKVDITDEEPDVAHKAMLSEEVSSCMFELPSGAKFKVG